MTQLTIVKTLIFTLLFLWVSNTNAQSSSGEITGELKQWHKITIAFEGEKLSEDDAYNPFLNYRMNVTFVNGSKEYVVPGYFAADGNAGESSTTSGKVWKVHFAPDLPGKWNYQVSFRKGDAIAVNDDPNAGEPVFFNGANGNFTVGPTDKTGSDFRAKGRLSYVGKRYLQFEGNKEYLLKGGAGSPENFLGYFEFDQTPPTHHYEPHAKDWQPGDPTWQNGKGKNIIGALNYLASEGMNTLYFLSLNAQGDGDDVWPWNNYHERYRYDCSKLDQ